MITREEYEEALNICNKYLRQINAEAQTVKSAIASLDKQTPASILTVTDLQTAGLTAFSPIANLKTLNIKKTLRKFIKSICTQYGEDVSFAGLLLLCENFEGERSEQGYWRVTKRAFYRKHGSAATVLEFKYICGLLGIDINVTNYGLLRRN